MSFVKLFLKYHFSGNISVYVFIAEIYVDINKKLIDEQ